MISTPSRRTENDLNHLVKRSGWGHIEHTILGQIKHLDPFEVKLTDFFGIRGVMLSNSEIQASFPASPRRATFTSKLYQFPTPIDVKLALIAQLGEAKDTFMQVILDGTYRPSPHQRPWALDFEFFGAHGQRTTDF